MDARRRLLLAALLTPSALPIAAIATPIVQDELWTDTRRRREVPVRIRWPEGAPPSGGHPVVLFSHGLGGSREGGEVWGHAWAVAGFVAVHLQHPGSDTPAVRAAWTQGGGLGQTAAPEQLIARAEDVHFAQDEIERRQAARQGSWAAVRARDYGLAGHSFGAHTVLAAAGQRYPAGITLAEPRIAAFVALSPTLPAGDPRAALAGITRPMLCITGTLDGDVVGNGATPERRAAVFDALPAGAKAQLLLRDADHFTFGGGTRTLGALQSRRAAAATRLEDAHHRVVAALTTDWWRAWLTGDTDARERLAQPAALLPGDSWQRG